MARLRSNMTWRKEGWSHFKNIDSKQQDQTELHRFLRMATYLTIFCPKSRNHLFFCSYRSKDSLGRLYNSTRSTEGSQCSCPALSLKFTIQQQKQSLLQTGALLCRSKCMANWWLLMPQDYCQGPRSTTRKLRKRLWFGLDMWQVQRLLSWQAVYVWDGY